MKSSSAIQKMKEIVQRTNQSPVQAYNPSPEETQKNRFSQNLIPNDRFLYKSILENNTSFSQHPANEPSNYFSTFALAINSCLSAQSKLADTMSEIGMYLRELDGEAGSTLQSRKQAYVPQASLNYSLNGTSSKFRDTLSKKDSIESILFKLESLKKEITTKISDFEAYLSLPKTHNSVPVKELDIKVDDFHLQQENTSVGKLSDEKYMLKTPSSQKSASQHKFNSFQADICNRSKDYTNDLLNTSKLNASVQEDLKHEKNTQSPKASSSHNKSPSSNYLSFHDHTKAQESSENEKLTSDTHTTNLPLQESKKVVPPLNTEEFDREKSISQPKSTQPGHKKTETYIPSSAQHDLKKVIGASQTHKETKKAHNLPLHRPTQSVSFTKEVSLNLGALKNVIKPALTIVPQKQILDEIVFDSGLEKGGFKSHRSAVIINESPRYPNLVGQQNDDTDRVYFVPEMEEFHAQTQSFIRNTASLEKAVVKSLMKEDLAEDAMFKFKGNQGKIHQKKCLINSKWWRAWKDFVNFDADEESNFKSSFFEVSLYPRPGSINNKELLRQEAISDLGNLTADLELKDNLLEHHDYEGVSKKVYDILAKWYGSDFEICRVLRPDPFLGNKPYLELYPKKKASGRSNPKSFDASIGTDNGRMVKNILNSNLSQL